MPGQWAVSRVAATARGHPNSSVPRSPPRIPHTLGALPTDRWRDGGELAIRAVNQLHDGHRAREPGLTQVLWLIDSTPPALDTAGPSGAAVMVSMPNPGGIGPVLDPSASTRHGDTGRPALAPSTTSEKADSQATSRTSTRAWAIGTGFSMATVGVSLRTRPTYSRRWPAGPAAKATRVPSRASRKAPIGPSQDAVSRTGRTWPSRETRRIRWPSATVQNVPVARSQVGRVRLLARTDDACSAPFSRPTRRVTPRSDGGGPTPASSCRSVDTP